MNDENELKDVINRTKSWNELLCNGDEESHVYYSDPGLHLVDEGILVDWAMEELARRDAEQAERERPIDEEWLRSIGGHDIGGAWFFRGTAGRVVYDGLRWLWMVGTSVIKICENRGQLLDLLNSLKGGAT